MWASAEGHSLTFHICLYLHVTLAYQEGNNLKDNSKAQPCVHTGGGTEDVQVEQHQKRGKKMLVRSSLCVKYQFELFMSLSESLLRPWGLRGRERCRRRHVFPQPSEFAVAVTMDRTEEGPKKRELDESSPCLKFCQLHQSGTKIFCHGTYCWRVTREAGQLFEANSKLSVRQTICTVPENTGLKSNRTERQQQGKTLWTEPMFKHKTIQKSWPMTVGLKRPPQGQLLFFIIYQKLWYFSIIRWLWECLLINKILLWLMWCNDFPQHIFCPVIIPIKQMLLLLMDIQEMLQSSHSVVLRPLNG